jgi:hypothetical protein
VTLPAGATVTRTLTQQVPGNAPAGPYTYAVNVGTFPGPVLASDSFPVTKQAGAAPRSAEAGSWSVTGWEAAAASLASLPEGFALSEVHPNPFASQVRFTVEVAAAQAVRVAVYDGLGREIAVLHDGLLEAGAHPLALDGSSLPAGVYVVRVTGETFAVSRRATLLR